MNELSVLKNNLNEIENKINIVFQNKDLLMLSFIHSSYINENKKIITHHNERLEFLGDSALNFIVADYLYEKLSEAAEGKLSLIRSKLVNALSCAKYYHILKLDDYVILGKGEKVALRGKETIFSDAFEALIGAIYLDKGFNLTKEFILKNFQNDFDEAINNPGIDFKGKLQEYSQKKFQQPPEYKILKEEGPEHSKVFTVAVLINNEEMGLGKGFSKKQAELIAAEEAFNKLNLEG
ncbi:MAG: ribonuclease III [Parachlamydiales bacterium]